MEKEAVLLPKPLIEKLREYLPKTGFESIEEYLAYIIETVLPEEKGEFHWNKEDEEEIKKRLIDLGYME